MRLQLPAKVNWTLEVLGKRGDSFHELLSWFVAVDLCDTLEATPSAAGALEITGPRAEGLEQGAGNLVLAAETAWRAAGGEVPPLAWKLEKNIPVGGGLGGGSSNAAGALRLLELHATVGVGEERLAGLASSLGSDVPFFLLGEGAELRGGRGEILLARAPAPQAWLVLACPKIQVATADVYQALEASGLAPGEGGGGDPVPGESTPPPVPGANDLEAAALGRYPSLADLAEALGVLTASRKGPQFGLSGSGGCFFAACSDSAEAHELAHAASPLGADILVARTRFGAVLPPIRP